MVTPPARSSVTQSILICQIFFLIAEIAKYKIKKMKSSTNDKQIAHNKKLK